MPKEDTIMISKKSTGYAMFGYMRVISDVNFVPAHMVDNVTGEYEVERRCSVTAAMFSLDSGCTHLKLAADGKLADALLRAAIGDRRFHAKVSPVVFSGREDGESFVDLSFHIADISVDLAFNSS